MTSGQPPPSPPAPGAPLPPPPQQAPPGYPPPQQYSAQAYYPQAQPSNGIGITAGVLGIVAVLLMWIPFVNYLAIILGILAIIFGIIGIGRANRMGGAGKGMAITGLVCGIVALAISLLFAIAVYSIVTHVSPG